MMSNADDEIKSIDSELLFEGSPEIAEVAVEEVARWGIDCLRINVHPFNLQILRTGDTTLSREGGDQFGPHHIVLWVQLPSIIAIDYLHRISLIEAIGCPSSAPDCDRCGRLRGILLDDDGLP